MEQAVQMVAAAEASIYGRPSMSLIYSLLSAPMSKVGAGATQGSMVRREMEAMAEEEATPTTGMKLLSGFEPPTRALTTW